MGVLDGLANLHEQLQALRHAQPRGIAILGDRHALDVLHHEKGPARVRQPAVEHLGDIGVVHHGQGLPLGLEAGQHGLRVHAGLDELQRHLAADGLGLFGHPHRAHAALADGFQQLVAAGDDGAGLLAGNVGRRLLREARNWPVQQVPRLVVGAEQGINACPERGVPAQT